MATFTIQHWTIDTAAATHEFGSGAYQDCKEAGYIPIDEETAKRAGRIQIIEERRQAECDAFGDAA